MKTKSYLGIGTMVITIAVAIALSISTTLMVYAQNTTADAGQVKDYLNQAMQALGSNNTRALELVDLASDQLENMTGVADAGEEEDENETAEEGAGEDADEAGDVDKNDAEDVTPNQP